MIHRRNIKRLAAGLIINHFYIKFFAAFTGIDPVNLSTTELQLRCTDPEVSFFQLLCQRPDRPLQKFPDPEDPILVSR